MQRAIDKSAIPDWLSFRCGEDGADDRSSGAACGNLVKISQITHRDVATCVGRSRGRRNRQ